MWAFKLFSFFAVVLFRTSLHYLTTRGHRLADLLCSLYFIFTWKYVGLGLIELQILQPVPHWQWMSCAQKAATVILNEALPPTGHDGLIVGFSLKGNLHPGAWLNCNPSPLLRWEAVPPRGSAQRVRQASSCHSRPLLIASKGCSKAHLA